MSPRYHPTDDLLFEYGAGSLSEAVALAVAGHAAWCGECQARIAETEAVGGAVLETANETPLRPDALDTILARLDEPVAEEPALAVTDATRRTVPSPLWPYVGGDIDSLRWKRRTKGVETAPVPVTRPEFRAHLLRIEPGRSVPVHRHRGTELTLVLQGAYHDGQTHFAKGDLQIADASLNHQPLADDGETCICLAVLDKPLRFTGPVARYFNPFIRL